TLQNAASGACLTTANNATANDTRAVLGACTAASARWTVLATPTGGTPVSEVVTSSPIAPTTAPLPGEVSEPVASAAPELPRVTIDTRMPTPTGRTIAVPAGGDLQGALDAAQPGDVITLANGATYRGNFVLGAKAPGGWIVVRPASLSGLPAEGERLAPARHAAAMPKIVSPNGMFALATPDAQSGKKTHGWRFVGLEIASNEAVDVAQTLIELGNTNERTLAALSSHFVFDRVWIHGRTTQHVHRCLAINAAHAAVIDSYFSDCHTRGGEGQVIAGWQTPGPVKIQNNYLEGGTIGVLFGGADPWISGMIPSDIEVRGNHFLKPLTWKGVWSAKNGFELKNAQRVLVEGNVFENNWMDAQAGYMILFTPLSQSNLAPWTTVRDVTFRHNLLRNSAQGFMISSRNAYGANATPLTDVTRRVLIEHNVLERVGGRAFLVSNELQDVTIAHNVVSNSEYVSLLLVGDSTNAPAQRLVFRDNLVGRGYMLVSGDGTGEGRVALNAYARDAVIAGNLAYSTVAPGVGRTDLYPTTNAFVADAALAGITSGTINGVVVPRAQVSSLSAFFRSGTGGTTPGADLAAVARATATAVQR
ncbi:right-handed parallel beta-helix repeat-containing protein, partial [Roseisolibacter agri]|uniref:right-handed parallel beta-helix repeat-containing protein n=1 Tax=Roseisolibacter agri TaxID=2014610 RepID=UPI0024E15FEB